MADVEYYKGSLPEFQLSVDAAPKAVEDTFIDEDDLGNEPFAMRRCPACLRTNLHTATEQVATGRAIFVIATLSIILTPIAPFMPFFLIPIISHFMGDIRHSCPACDYVIGSARKCTLTPKMSNDVITIRIGSCATIIKKRALYGVSLVLAVLLGLRMAWQLLEYYGFPDIKPGLPCTEPCGWTDFQKLCPTKTNLGNELRCRKVFEDSFLERTVIWVGELGAVRSGFFRKSIATFLMGQGGTQAVVHALFDEKLNHHFEGVDSGAMCELFATVIDLPRRAKPLLLYLHSIKCNQA